MYKLFVLAALLAVAAARPSHLHGEPLIYSAPHATTIIEEPAYAKVGAVVKSIPTAVSHQSQSIVHSSAHVVEPIIAPVVKTYAAPLVYKSYEAPLSYAAPAPIYKSYAAPVTYAAAPVYKSYGAPLSYATSYAAPAHYSAW